MGLTRPSSSTASDQTRSGGEMRCGCGNLLARLVPQGVELKCRRCKRTVVLPLAEGASAGFT